MDLLDDNGTCCGVLKEGVFFDGKYSKLRQILLENYNVTNIISIPSDAFENTTTKTSIIIFKNDGNTKKIEFSELIVHNIEKDEFEINDDGEVELIKIKDEFNYIEEKKVCVASMKDIENNLTKEKCLYSLNMKDYKDYKVVCPEGYELKKLLEFLEYEKKSKRNASFATEDGKFRFYTSSDKIKKCDECDFNDDKLKLIFGTGGVGSLFIDNKFSCSADNFVCTAKDKYNLLYIYDYIKTNWDKFTEKYFNGSVLANIGKDKLSNCEIPFPKNMDKHKKQLDNLYKIHQEIMTGTDQIPQSEQEICELIKKATDEGKKGVDYEEYKLGDVCEVKAGAYLKNKNMGIYPIYGGGDISGYSDTYNNNGKNDIIISRVGNALKNGDCVRILNGKYYLNDNGFKCENIKINKLLFAYILILNKNLIMNLVNESAQPVINKTNLLNIVIKIPTENKMKKLKLQEKFDEVDKLKEDLEKNKQLYQDKMKEFFKDFEDATLKSSKDDFLPQKKSIAFCSEKDNSSELSESSDSNEKKEEVKPKKKVKPIKKVESSSESESDNDSDSSEEDTKPKKIVKKIEISDSEKPKKKPKPVKKIESSSSESDSSSDSSSESESSSEDLKPKKKVKPVNKSK